jgi:hypothetical protein
VLLLFDAALTPTAAALLLPVLLLPPAATHVALRACALLASQNIKPVVSWSIEDHSTPLQRTMRLASASATHGALLFALCVRSAFFRLLLCDFAIYVDKPRSSRLAASYDKAKMLGRLSVSILASTLFLRSTQGKHAF